MKKAFLSFFLILSCSSVQRNQTDIKFVVTANTYPESAFKTQMPEAELLSEKMNSENPVLLIHMGNLVQGGSKSVGISETDMTRQLDSAKRAFSKFRSVSYFIPADKDKFDNNFTLFNRNSGHKEYFSFNYGSIHFIALNPYGDTSPEIDSKQIEWLKSDLGTFSGKQTIVFSKTQLLGPSGNSERTANAFAVHDILKKRNIIAVISSDSSVQQSSVKDGIEYINLPVAPLSSRSSGFNFYNIIIKSGRIQWEGKKIK